MQKMIKIPSEGRIVIRGDMYGPLHTPHMENVEKIGLMLFYNVPVVEVLADGAEVQLTLENYNKDNSTGGEVTPPDPNPELPGDGSGEVTKQVQPEQKAEPVKAEAKPQQKNQGKNK